MTTPGFSDDIPTGIPALNLDGITPTDVPLEDNGKPDASASREPRKPRGLFGRKPAGDRSETPSRRTPKQRAKLPPKKRGQLIEPLTNLYTSLGALMTPFDPICGTAIIQAAPQCAEALDELAQTNDVVRRALYAMVTTSTVGLVLAAHAPILLAVAMHHVPAMQSMLGAMGQKFADTVEQNMPPAGEASP